MYNRMPPRGSGAFPVGGHGAMAEDADRVDLRDLAHKIWRRKRTIVGCIVAGALLAGVAVSQVTPLYTASSKVMLDPRKGRVTTTQAVVSNLDVSAQLVNSEVAVLDSNVLIDKVIKEIGVDRLALLDPGVRLSLMARLKNLVGLGKQPVTAPTAGVLQARKTERLVYAVRKALTVRSQPKSYVISISVKTPSPKVSMLLAGTIADQYIANQLLARKQTAERASVWISNRVDQLRTEVERAEQAVETFRSTSLVLEGSSLETATAQLFEMNTRLATARSDRAVATARYDQLLRVIDKGGIKAADAIVTSPTLQALNAQRIALMHKDAVWAERYAVDHPMRQNLRNEITQIDADIDTEIRKQVDVQRNAVDTAKILENSMAASLNEMEQRVNRISANALGLRELERKVTASRQAYTQLLTRLTEIQSQEQLQRADAKLVERATIPGAPSSPRPKLLIAMGGFLGGAVGLALAFFLELSGTTFRSETEIESLTGLPVLAMIPQGDWASPRAAYREMEHSPNGIIAERIRHLRTALLTGVNKDRGRSIMITSSVPAEGKTTTTLALAKMAALAGKTVIVVDCDLRRASLHQAFEWQMDWDLGDFIHDQCSLGDAIYSDPRLGFDVLASSEPMPMAADELSETWLKPMLDMLTRHYDVVLLDTPPALAVSDALVLAQMVDTTVYLVRWGQTPRPAVLKGLGLFENISGGPSGIVLTMVDMKSSAMSYTEDYAYGV